MEVILLPELNKTNAQMLKLVLILVFMEVILLHFITKGRNDYEAGFNPCFYGSYSFTRRNSTH